MVIKDSEQNEKWLVEWGGMMKVFENRNNQIKLQNEKSFVQGKKSNHWVVVVVVVECYAFGNWISTTEYSIQHEMAL